MEQTNTIQNHSGGKDDVPVVPNQNEHPSHSSHDSHSSARPSSRLASPARTTRHFSLKKGYGLWELTFNGQRTVLRDEQGLGYVAWLLQHPGESIHALDLAVRVARAANPTGIVEIVNPETGQVQTLPKEARLQERVLGLEEAETIRSVLRLQEKLEAILDDEDVIGPVKEEAQRQLLELYQYEKHRGPRVRDNAAKASDAVGRAIRRLELRLLKAVNPDGTPNTTLHKFAKFIRSTIILPSGRGNGHGGMRPGRGEGGFFIYHAPGAKWA